MKFSPQLVDKIRERLPLSQVIGRKVRLEAKGKEFLGLCPFHQEKSPSFTVNNDKQFYHCFGCGAHGDVVKYTMFDLGLEFVDALRHLAKEAGVEMPVSLVQVNYQQNKDLYEVMNLACQWFEQQLHLAKNQQVLKYLQQRQISDEIIAKFSLGFAPADPQGLSNELKKQGVDHNMLIRTGLVIEAKQGSSYDRFRSRIMFPIMDNQGRVIAFGGRAYGDIQPKYLNSPETSLFKKGEVLYAQHLAKEAVLKSHRVIVVEGYVDVIAMHAAGFVDTVASLGTAITEENLKHLWRLSAEPIICMDGDSAGVRAAKKVAIAAVPLLKAGMSLRFASLPSSLDPDDCLKTYGKEGMEKIISSVEPLSSFLWKNEFAKLPKNPTPEQKAALETHLLELVQNMQDAVVKSNYRSYFMQQLWQQVKKGHNKSTPVSQANIHSLMSLSAAFEDNNYLERLQRTLLAIIINYPELLSNDEVVEELIHIEFANEVLDTLRIGVLEAKSAVEILDKEQIIAYLKTNDFISDIVYWDKVHAVFASGPGQADDPLSLWSYSFNKYRLEILEAEYKLALRGMNDVSMIKAAEIRKYILRVKADIASMDQKQDDE